MDFKTIYGSQNIFIKKISQRREILVYNWRDKPVDWIFPFKGIDDPKYIKARDKTFKKNGHGWWWNDGKGWQPKAEIPSVIRKRYRLEKESLYVQLIADEYS